jgi:hypothetical protein
MLIYLAGAADYRHAEGREVGTTFPPSLRANALFAIVNKQMRCAFIEPYKMMKHSQSQAYIGFECSFMRVRPANDQTPFPFLEILIKFQFKPPKIIRIFLRYLRHSRKIER